jgi:hypothetical protein
MDEFLLRGKIIDKDNWPLKGHRVLAFDADDFVNPNDFLGEAIIDDKGLFEIRFDKSKFSNGLEFLEGTPDVFLTIKDHTGKDLVKTGVMQTQREIEYHIKINHHLPENNFKDIYSGNAQRMIATLREVGNMIGLEGSLNLDILAHSTTKSHTSREKPTENFNREFEQRKDNFNHLFVALNSLVNSFVEELRIGPIGYDGPQVGKFPRKEEYDMVISWPHKEKFAWA